MSIRSSNPWRAAVSLEAAVVDTRFVSFRPTNRISLDLCSNASRARDTCLENVVSVHSCHSKSGCSVRQLLYVCGSRVHDDERDRAIANTNDRQANSSLR